MSVLCFISRKNDSLNRWCSSTGVSSTWHPSKPGSIGTLSLSKLSNALWPWLWQITALIRENKLLLHLEIKGSFGWLTPSANQLWPLSLQFFLTLYLYTWRTLSLTCCCTDSAFSLTAGIILPGGKLHRGCQCHWESSSWWNCCFFKESYAARHGLISTTNIYRALHLRKEPPLSLWPVFWLFLYLLFYPFRSFPLFPPLACFSPHCLYLSPFLGFLTRPSCQAGFPADEASEEKEEEQLQRERNTDSHQGDPQEERCVILQAAGSNSTFTYVIWWIRILL